MDDVGVRRGFGAILLQAPLPGPYCRLWKRLRCLVEIDEDLSEVARHGGARVGELRFDELLLRGTRRLGPFLDDDVAHVAAPNGYAEQRGPRLHVFLAHADELVGRRILLVREPRKGILEVEPDVVGWRGASLHDDSALGEGPTELAP